MPENVPDDRKAKLIETQTKILNLVKSRVSWDKMRPQYVKLYAETFTDEEIDGLVKFYDSAAGKAMITKMPAVISKSMAIALTMMNDF